MVPHGQEMTVFYRDGDLRLVTIGNDVYVGDMEKLFSGVKNLPLFVIPDADLTLHGILSKDPDTGESSFSILFDASDVADDTQTFPNSKGAFDWLAGRGFRAEFALAWPYKPVNYSPTPGFPVDKNQAENTQFVNRIQKGSLGNAINIVKAHSAMSLDNYQGVLVYPNSSKVAISNLDTTDPVEASCAFIKFPS